MDSHDGSPHHGAHVLHHAWRSALKSLRANLIPGLILQFLMAFMGAAYLWHPGARRFFDGLGAIRTEWGFFFSFVGTSAASAFLPELLRLVTRSKSQPDPQGHGHGLGARLLFAIPFWGLIGMQVDLFYRIQFWIFGPSETFSVILRKVLVDAFLYCPLIAIPEAVAIFLWRDHGFTTRGFHGWTPGRFYALRIFPVLMANWMVWIPLVTIIYSLPASLGVAFFIIAQSFWVMVFTTLSSSHAKKA